MRSITIGPSAKHTPVTTQMLQNAQTQMQKPSEDKTQVCNVLRLSKGGYSHRRRRVQKSA
ncbi:hypothetical protein [Brucella pseudogrignonensis]|uniref:Transposase n=1 Tax=Brucella pseudogrignonensis TaxID=419475 RepID=A0ABU1M896_9HYPH|nr:hypothetical protein [Brucella pseudogrignonensis]MCL7998924.1 hypothetical protein [Brucella sp. 21LCYQ03]MDR6432264.1 hypothetical protein [Brucella pseudogrignonensis]